MLLFWFFIFILALGGLIKASDWFIDAAEKIGIALGIPSFIIGVTIVAAGTSLPELTSSIIAVFNNSSEFVVGNVIGSNVTNIFLILGISAVLSKIIRIKYNLMNIDMPLLLGSAFLLYLFLLDGKYSKLEALISLGGLAMFLVYSFTNGKAEPGFEKKKIHATTYLRLAVSGIAIYFGADYTVESVSKMAEILDIGKDVVALSLVAFGTSVPELIVSVVAARKGNPEIAIGNILGSNIFNTFAVMGIPGLFANLEITPEITQFSLPIMMVATIMFMVMTLNRKVTIWEGVILLLFYVFYVGDLIARNL